MIAQLTGTVLDITPLSVTLDVHGVGYLVHVTGRSGFALDTTVTLHTHLAVRENALDLYGFASKEELGMFHELIKLPKIGPKTALQILSQAEVETILEAVRQEDPSYLSKMSGIGKKSAEKIIDGLKEIYKDGVPTINGNQTLRNNDTDVIDALITLGYSQKDVLDAVKQIPEDITETKARIKHTLKNIGK